MKHLFLLYSLPVNDAIAFTAISQGSWSENQFSATHLPRPKLSGDVWHSLYFSKLLCSFIAIQCAHPLLYLPTHLRLRIFDDSHTATSSLRAFLTSSYIIHISIAELLLHVAQLPCDSHTLEDYHLSVELFALLCEFSLSILIFSMRWHVIFFLMLGLPHSNTCWMNQWMHES